jgi:hypothetical protein
MQSNAARASSSARGSISTGRAIRLPDFVDRSLQALEIQQP